MSFNGNIKKSTDYYEDGMTRKVKCGETREEGEEQFGTVMNGKRSKTVWKKYFSRMTFLLVTYTKSKVSETNSNE